MYLKIFQVICVLLLLYVTWTEVVVPLKKGTRLFPSWNKRRNKLNEDLVGTREELELQSTEADLKTLKSHLNQEEPKS